MLFTHKVNCLQTFEHMTAHQCFLRYIPTRVLEILREDILIICGCVVFTNIQFSSNNDSDGVSTWEKFDGHI